MIFVARHGIGMVSATVAEGEFLREDNHGRLYYDHAIVAGGEMRKGASPLGPVSGGRIARGRGPRSAPRVQRARADGEGTGSARRRKGREPVGYLRGRKPLRRAAGPHRPEQRARAVQKPKTVACASSKGARARCPSMG